MTDTLIEICVDSPRGLHDAVAGGADRIELCAALSLGGLTPSPGLMALARDCPVPVRAMIRPREGDFHYDAAARAAMLRDVDAVRDAGLNGVVIGALTPDCQLDVPLLEELMARAAGLDVTLHRAVDLLVDPVAAVAIAARLGIRTILTAGGAPTAQEGEATIAAMRREAGDRVEIMAGSGVRAANVAALVARTGVAAVHASASKPRAPSGKGVEMGFETALARVTDAAEVAALRRALQRPPATPAARSAEPRDPATTLMHREAGEAPAVVAQMLARNRAAIEQVAARLRDRPPPFIVTCARGSSDHAATFGKYLFETQVGVPVASAAPSIASVYDAPLRADGALCLAISQSGQSPDLLAAAAAHQKAGAFVVALVNDEGSPLAGLADAVLPLCAGPERSVAATKSYIAALAVQVALAAAWRGNAALLAALEALPASMAQAFDLDWSAALPPLLAARNLFVLGRGHSFGIAQEAALKFKETYGLHAEAFSAAEVRHGPMAIVGRGFPVLGFATSDPTGDDVRAAGAQFADRGALALVSDARGNGMLPAIAADPILEPILMVQSFYRFVNALAVARGIDPDAPPHLKKVTETR